jgi:hypothetical protein
VSGAAKKVGAHARVTLTIEVPAGTWGSDCALDQVYAQAAREAIEKVTRLLEGQARIVGEARVVAVLAEQERR